MVEYLGCEWLSVGLGGCVGGKFSNLFLVFSEKKVSKKSSLGVTRFFLKFTLGSLVANF